MIALRSFLFRVLCIFAGLENFQLLFQESIFVLIVNFVQTRIYFNQHFHFFFT